MSGNVNALWGNTKEINHRCIELGSATLETGVNNAGSAFNIKNYNDAGSNIATPFSINRTSGQTTITNLLLTNVTNISIGGGTSGAILATNGAGILSWIPASSVGIPEAPTDGRSYGRSGISGGSWFPVLPISGGELTGSLIVDFNITCQGTVFPSTLTMNNGNFINFLDSQGGSANGFVLGTNNLFIFSLTNSSGVGQTIFSLNAHVTNPAFTFAVPVMLSADPSAPLGVATKQYVDGKFGDIDAGGY